VLVMKKRVLLILILFAATSFLIAEEKLVGGPYVVNVGQRSATVAWVVETGQVSLGTAPGQAEKTAPVLRSE